VHPTLDSALDTITELDSRGDHLCGNGFPTGVSFVDGEVLDLLRAAAPVNHGIDSPWQQRWQDIPALQNAS
jgi:hypothetical protein